MRLYHVPLVLVVIVVPALVLAALALIDRLRNGPPDLSSWWEE